MMEGFIASFRGPNYKEAGAGMFAQCGTESSAEPGADPGVFSEYAAAGFSSAHGREWPTIRLGPDKIDVLRAAIWLSHRSIHPILSSFIRASRLTSISHVEGVGHFLMIEKPKSSTSQCSGSWIKTHS